MIDIHNHILFGIDDGAEDIDTCVQMCIDAHKNGCTAIAVTPHFFKYNKLDDFIYERTEKQTGSGKCRRGSGLRNAPELRRMPDLEPDL